MIAPQAEHPARKKARLRALLGTGGGVAALPSLERRQLAPAVDWLALPRVIRSARTRVTQVGSARDLTFVALEEGMLTRPHRELMHLAALTETYLRLQEMRDLRGFMAPEELWKPVTAQGHARAHHLPDAEIVGTVIGKHGRDCAVEFDAGYDFETITRKLQGFAELGYRRVLWATSIHERTRSVRNKAIDLCLDGELTKLSTLDVVWVDFWSARDRYGPRPRCLKWNHTSLNFKDLP